MNSVTSYVYSVTVAAILLSLLRPLLDGKGASGAIRKMLAGMFLLFTILKPWTQFRIGSLDDFTYNFQSDAAAAVSTGQAAAKKELSAIITEQVEAYILDKAKQFDADLSVTVELSEDEIPVPVRVTICGSISPYGKRQVQDYISDKLGIAKENQTWK